MLEPTVTPHTIVLVGELGEHHVEDRADAAINPGYLVKMTTTGVAKHSTAGGDGARRFAKEEGFGTVGTGATRGTINAAYAQHDIVPQHIAQPGDLIFARLAASATAVVAGSPITSAGDGTMKLASGSDFVYGHAEEAKDNSGGGAEAFFKLRIK